MPDCCATERVILIGVFFFPGCEICHDLESALSLEAVQGRLTITRTTRPNIGHERWPTFYCCEHVHVACGLCVHNVTDAPDTIDFLQIQICDDLCVCDFYFNSTSRGSSTV